MTTKLIYGLLTIVLFCSKNYASNSSDISSFKLKQESLNIEVISKIESYKTSTELKCNLRIQNSDQNTVFIKKVILEFEIEGEVKKDKSSKTEKQLIEFNKAWIVAQDDYAFFEPMNHQLDDKKIKWKKVKNCKVHSIQYGSNSTQKGEVKSIPFNQEEAIGYMNPILFKVKFQKKQDQQLGYYKTGLQSYLKPPVKVDCILKYENNGSSLVKIKNEFGLNLAIDGQNFLEGIQEQKIKASQSKVETIFSIHFSGNIKMKEMKMFLESDNPEFISK